MKRKSDNLSTQLPVTKTGNIQEAPKAKSHFNVGLESTLIDPEENPVPSNLQPITVTSVAMNGKLFANVDDGLDALPDLFFNSLGAVNDEIEAASGSKRQISLADILGGSPEITKKVTTTAKSQSSGKITAKDLQGLGLDVQRLEQMGLTLEELNKRGLKLSDLQQILET